MRALTGSRKAAADALSQSAAVSGDVAATLFDVDGLALGRVVVGSQGKRKQRLLHKWHVVRKQLAAAKADATKVCGF